MKVLSLFSGVGGFDLGLENAGMETVFQCEWDKHATSILQRHWPDTPRWGDITTLTSEHILNHAPVIDIVAWGSPCQDLSVAGKRAGLEGSRSGLFHQGIRIINELRKATNNVYPRISIWENVYGALNSNKGSDFGVILDEMAEAGSLVQEWRVLDAQYFGVPQRRRRVFLISVFDTAIAANCPDPLLPVCEGVRWDSATSRTTRQEPAGTVTESLASGRDIANTISAELYHKSTVVNQDVNNGHLVVRNPILGSDIVGALNTSDAKMISSQYVNENKVVVEPFVKSRRAQTTSDHETWKPSQVNPTLNSFDLGDTRATTAIVEPLLIDGTRVDDIRIYDPPVQTLKERMGTGGNNVPVIGFSHTQGLSAQPSEAAWPTLRKEGSGHAVAIPTVTEPTMSVRRLTPLECERLMGWPDRWTETKADGTPQADTHRYKQCGNGVASPVAQWIGQQLLNLDKEHHAPPTTTTT